MIIKFNPSGTHVHKGKLKVRVDLYPDVGDKTYEMHHVYLPVIPEGGYPGKLDKDGVPIDQKDYDSWVASLPHVWQLNPCLCHFITVPSTIDKVELELFIASTLNADSIATIDDIMVQPDSMHLISPFMRDKGILQKETIVTLDKEKLISDVNTRLAGISIGGDGGGEITPIEPESIDIGPGTFDGPGAQPAKTYVVLTNPANADGTIDTFKFWFDNPGVDVKAAVFYGSGSSYTCRDWETVGSVAAGSEKTFTGLDIDVATGDFAGTYYSNGNLEWHTYASPSFAYKSGDQTTTGTQTYTGPYNGEIALYGTGEEAGGVNYPISISTAGLTASVTIDRDVTWDRAVSAGLTVATSILKGWGRAIATTTAGLTASATVAYKAAWDRAITTGLTASIIVSHKVAWDKTVIAGLTVVTNVARKVAWDRTIAPGLTISATVIKGFGRSISTTAGLTVSATVAKAVAWHKALTPGLTVAVSLLKGWGRSIALTTAGLAVSASVVVKTGWKISTTAGLTISATIARKLAFDRAVSAGLTASATVARKLAWDRAIQPGLTLAVTILKGFGRSISTSPGLTVSATILKGWGRKITTSAGLTISATIAKTVAWKRAIQAGLTASATIAKSYGWTVLSAPGLTISTTIARKVAWHRALTPGLTTAVTILRSMGRTITSSAGLTISATIAKSVAFKRAISAGLTAAISLVATFVGAVNYLITVVANLTASASVNRTVALKRAITTGLTISVSVIAHSLLGIVRRLILKLRGRTLTAKLPDRRLILKLHNRSLIATTKDER